MKVKIRETYVQCDICGKKISRHSFYNYIYQIKVKKVEKRKLKLFCKKDLCNDCYNKFEGFVRKELKEAKKNENI